MAETGPTRRPPEPYVVSLERPKRRDFGHERPQEILLAAHELFLEYGFENVSTRQIANRVGISQTALYVYFGSKEEMLDTLVEAAFGKLGATFKMLAPPDNPVANLRLAVQGYIRFGLANPDDYRIAFLLRKGRHPAEQAAGDKPRSIEMWVFSVLENLNSDALASDTVGHSSLDSSVTAQVL